MVNPRDDIRFDGLNPRYRTYKHDSTIVYDSTVAGGAAQVGLAVTLTGELDGVVSTVADGERVSGKLLKVESDGFCRVQVGGVVELPAGTSATITVGSTIVGDLLGAAEGYIQTGTTAGSARGEILNNDTTTAVVIDLDAL